MSWRVPQQGLLQIPGVMYVLAQVLFSEGKLSLVGWRQENVAPGGFHHTLYRSVGKDCLSVILRHVF